jgi:hypothetical protein
MRFDNCVKLLIKRSGLLLFAFLLVYLCAVILFMRAPLSGGMLDGRADSHPKHQHGDFRDISELKVFREKRFLAAQNKKHDAYSPGQFGVPVQLSEEEQAEADRLFAKETFNVIASNKVPLDRAVPDTRMYE